MSNVIPFRRPPSTPRGFVFAAVFTECVYIGNVETEGASHFCLVVQKALDQVGASFGDFGDMNEADAAALRYAETHGLTFLPWFAPLCGGAA